jgi:hypothetical protein
MHNTRRNPVLAATAVIVSLVAPLSASHAAQTGSAYDPLASQNQSGFGEPIAFVAGSYTPPGIVGIVRGPLASQDNAGFGEAIAFVASSYTPPGIVGVLPIEVVQAR